MDVMSEAEEKKEKKNRGGQHGFKQKRATWRKGRWFWVSDMQGEIGKGWVSVVKRDNEL